MRAKIHDAAPLPQAGDRAHQALQHAFLMRSVKMLQRVSSSASSEALKSALSSPTRAWPTPSRTTPGTGLG